MAIREFIELGGGNSEWTINVSGSVGHAGRNLLGDVLLIQALFNYIGRTPRVDHGENLISDPLVWLGGEDAAGGRYKLPGLTGVMDSLTITAIVQFQIAQRHTLLISRFDGVIDPAKYRGRVLRNLVSARLLSITRLHVLAKNAERMRGDGDYVNRLSGIDARLDEDFFNNMISDW